MTRCYLFATFQFFCLFFFPVYAVAWNALGHMIIANIAYQNLTPATQTKVDYFIRYFKNEYSDMGSFMQMAYWPDAIRAQKIEMFTHWHYIDVPFSKDGTELKNIIDNDNAMWALAHLQSVVKFNQANNYERARFLGFLIHIVGDLHQPLHTVALISKANPKGDKGGNLYAIVYQKSKTNLHHLWDSGLGVLNKSATDEKAKELSRAITALYPKKSFPEKKLNDMVAEHWVQEGMVNAQSYVYNTPENEIVSTDYIEKGRQIAQEELALAGYRLGTMLNQMLG